MSDLQGFEYICDILSIISSNPEKKEKYRQYKRSRIGFDNGSKEILVWDWTLLAMSVLRRAPEKVKELVKEYHLLAADSKDYQGDVLKRYMEDVHEQFINQGKRKTLSNAFNNILVNQKGSRPYFLFGIAVTIVLATEGYSDENFYIGMEETKELLFKAMEIFDHTNVQYIPDQCFTDEKNLKMLLLTVLYHSLLVVLPYHEEHKALNLKNGLDMIRRVLSSDAESSLFTAIRSVSEADAVMRALWKAQEERCKREEAAGEMLSLEQVFWTPAFVPNQKYRLMDCDLHYRIRSFVEGKSGSGKTCLAKAIVLACKDHEKEYGFLAELSSEIGLTEASYVPIMLSCKNLDMNTGLFEMALNQMYLQGISGLWGETRDREVLRHYEECKDYILKYVERKAQAEELLLLIDDLSMLEKDLLKPFLQKLDYVCSRYPKLHVIIFSNRLKPSEKRLFPKYEVFTLAGLSKEELSDRLPGEISPELAAFLDTPGRLFQYLARRGEDLPIRKLAAQCMEEEIGRKCEIDLPEHAYRDFFIRLSAEALNRRSKKSEPLIIPENLVSAGFLMQMESSDLAERIWRDICQKRILLEQSAYVNSYEFSSPLFFHCLITEHFLEVMKSEGEVAAAGKLLIEMEKLSAEEFAGILPGLLERITEEHIREEQFSHLLLIISGVLLSFTEKEELKICSRMLEKLMSSERLWDTLYDAFPQLRKKMACTMKKWPLTIDSRANAQEKSAE